MIVTHESQRNHLHWQSWRLSVAWDKMGDMDIQHSAGDRPNEPWAMPREYEIGGVRWFTNATQEMARALHPLLAQVTRIELAEGPAPQPEGTPLPREASSLYRPMAVQHVWTVSIEDVAAFNVEQFLSDLHALADDTGGQMVRGMLEHISDVTEEYGNNIDAAGRDFADVFADTLETIDMTFDEEGRPNLTVVLHPDQARKLRDNPPSPDQEARITAILDRRREEWLASRRRRDLP